MTTFRRRCACSCGHGARFTTHRASQMACGPCLPSGDRHKTVLGRTEKLPKESIS